MISYTILFSRDGLSGSENKGKGEMKKLMVLAAVAVMSAISAKADFVAVKGTVIAQFDSVSGVADYNACYLLNAANYMIWSINPIASSLPNASWEQTSGTGLMNLMMFNVDAMADTGKLGFPQKSASGTYSVSMAVVLAKGNESFYAGMLVFDAQYSTTDGWNIGSVPISISGAAKPFAPEPVPEPTSGLLLLIGVAGLALKRKAKIEG